MGASYFWVDSYARSRYFAIVDYAKVYFCPYGLSILSRGFYCFSLFGDRVEYVFGHFSRFVTMYLFIDLHAWKIRYESFKAIGRFKLSGNLIGVFSRFATRNVGLSCRVTFKATACIQIA